MNEVDVALSDIEPPSWLADYRRYCRIVLDEAGLVDSELSVLLTDAEGMQTLNLRYREIDSPTDVLSFPQRGDTESGPQTRALGDVVVCPSVIRDHARGLNIPFDEELHRVTIHGVLHLLGMDHKGDEEMLRYQEELLLRVNKERKG